jgi:hypothetical protein
MIAIKQAMAVRRQITIQMLMEEISKNGIDQNPTPT